MPTGVYQRKPRVQRVTITCEVCSRTRELLPSNARQLTGRFCSAKCAGFAGRTALDTQCGHCQKPIKIRPVAAGRKHFCSVSCAAIGKRVDGAKWRDPKQIAAYMVEYHKRNRERLNALACLRNPRYRQKKNENQRLRRATGYRPRGIQRKAWASILTLCGSRCLKCGSTDRLEADHVLPVTLGGLNSVENYQPLCRSCNASKSDTHVDYRSPKLKRAIMATMGYEILET